MKHKLNNSPIFLATAILFMIVSISCNAQSAEKKGEKEKSEINKETVTKIRMSVNGMSCMGCVANVKNTIEELEGVKEVEVSLEEKQAIVTYVSTKIQPEKIQDAVNKKGFTAGKPEKQNK